MVWVEMALSRRSGGSQDGSGGQVDHQREGDGKQEETTAAAAAAAAGEWENFAGWTTGPTSRSLPRTLGPEAKTGAASDLGHGTRSLRGVRGQMMQLTYEHDGSRGHRFWGGCGVAESGFQKPPIEREFESVPVVRPPFRWTLAYVTAGRSPDDTWTTRLNAIAASLLLQADRSAGAGGGGGGRGRGNNFDEDDTPILTRNQEPEILIEADYWLLQQWMQQKRAAGLHAAVLVLEDDGFRSGVRIASAVTQLPIVAIVDRQPLHFSHLCAALMSHRPPPAQVHAWD